MKELIILLFHLTPNCKNRNIKSAAVNFDIQLMFLFMKKNPWKADSKT